MNKKPCRFFNSPKGCPKGDECPFLHQKTKNRRCRFFVSPQGCPFGTNCTFTHEPVLLEKYKMALNKSTDEHSGKKRKIQEPICFCPVCKETFENWENTKAHFEETGHLGAHCTQCGKSFVVVHHRNIHEKETSHDIFKGVLVQETHLKEIPEEKPRIALPPSNDPPHLLVDHFYHGIKTSFDLKTLNEKYVVHCLDWLVNNNVFKGTVKAIGIQLLLSLEDTKLQLTQHDDVKRLIAQCLVENQDLQFIFQMNHLWQLNTDLGDLEKYKQTKMELKQLESLLDNEITEFGSLKDPKAFNALILDKFEKNKPSLNDSKRVQDIFDYCSSLIKTLWKDCQIDMFGSTMLDLYDSSSDIDINVSIPDKYMLTDKHALLQLETLLKKNKVEQVYLVLNSRVPLLSFVVNGIDVDVVTNKNLNIKKTQLIAEYIKLDKRCAPLLYCLKRWKSQVASKFVTNECFLTKDGDLNLSTNQSRELTFYCLALMGIFYLQTKNPPVLPNLQGEFHGEWRSENQESVGELLMGFFKEFAFFDYGKIISIRKGAPLDHEESNIKNYSVCVEDPMENDVSAARQIARRKLYIEFKRALLYLYKNESIW